MKKDGEKEEKKKHEDRLRKQLDKKMDDEGKNGTKTDKDNKNKSAYKIKKFTGLVNKKDNTKYAKKVAKAAVVSDK